MRVPVCAPAKAILCGWGGDGVLCYHVVPILIRPAVISTDCTAAIRSIVLSFHHSFFFYYLFFSDGWSLWLLFAREGAGQCLQGGAVHVQTL